MVYNPYFNLDTKVKRRATSFGLRLGSPPAVTDAQLKVGHWNRFDHPWGGKTMPLVTTDAPGAITGEYFVPNSSMQFVQIISDESVKGKSIALPSLSKTLTD